MSNRLAAETSPYLQQHAENPVEWYPWGEEALTLARRLDRPILLSVGYSACHWCHVMAHESFEDPAVAAVMNEHFVNVKVDREERPDLDQIYQTAHFLLTRRNGGWPLTLFLTPAQKPYFGGTYFPKTARHGMPGFRDLLPRIAEAYRSRRPEIDEQSDRLLAALAATVPEPEPAGKDLPGARTLVAAVDELARVFDHERGGLGRAPKFPHPCELEFLLRRHAAGATDGLAMVTLTLTQMARGGIYDQIGGGFCRYSVDDEWTIPHFEKMLYDNGPLLALYADAWLVTREPLYARVASETAAWVIRDMQSPDGGYYSSLDADSEQEEGRFYVWGRAEVRDLLTAQEYAAAELHYGLDGAANFEGRQWHLRVHRSPAEVARMLGIAEETCGHHLHSARAKLLARRNARVWPGRDEKILTSWNALMIRSMARAARAFDRPDWLASARRARDFLHSRLWQDGRLLATHKDGRSHLNAYLDDYAFLLDALVELMQCDFRPEDLAWAQALGDALLEHFEDRAAGGFYFTSHDHERLIHRAKPGPDNATPSGNGVATTALLKLASLVGAPRYAAAAERTVALFGQALERQPSGFPSLLAALELQLEPPRTAILRGPAAAVQEWQRELATAYRPGALILGIAAGVTDLPEVLAKPVGPEVNAWVCRGVKCLPPIADISEVVRSLRHRADGLE
jgi:uncharacterized protein YyaL (SSP411 family)